MRVAVVGAGFGGLAAAWDLVRAGHEVTVLESAGEVGGLGSGFRQPHWQWSVERFYHHWFASDRHLLGLIRELGLEERLVFRRPTTVMYHAGRFYPFDSPLAALRFPGLGWGDTLRFGLVGAYLRHTTRWQPLERVTAAAWMRRWAGERAWREMWRPMMVGKFSETWAEAVPMAWLWARLHVRTASLGTYEGGFQAFADDVAGALRRLGVAIRLHSPVEGITATAGGLELRHGGAAGDGERFDRCLVTVSPALLARMAPQLPADYLGGLLGLKSLGALAMVLALDRPLSPEGYYWYNLPKSEGFPFLALVEHTRFVPADRFGGDHIVYCGDYLPVEHEHMSLGRDELLARFLPALRRVNPTFEPSWLRDAWLHRTSYAQPVPLLDHSRNIPAIATPLPGLFFASMSQVYPWDRGSNFAVEIGRRAAALVVAG